LGSIRRRGRASASRPHARTDRTDHRKRPNHAPDRA